MKIKTLNATMVKEIIGDKFRFFSATENFLYEDGKENR